MWLLVLLRPYLKHLIFLGMISFVLLGLYLKGRSDYREKIERESREEIQRRLEEYEKARKKLEKSAEDLRNQRESTPTDALDTCIMSNNPFKKECKNAK